MKTKTDSISLKYPTVNIDVRYLYFGTIVFFTLLNGFYNSMCGAYGIFGFPYYSFLFRASDLHADLIKMAIGNIPIDVHIDTSSWSSVYQHYWEWHTDGADTKNHFNNSHMPPLSYILGWGVSILLQYTSPYITIGIFYSIVVTILIWISYKFTHNYKIFPIIFFGMLLSYPVLFMLNRGHLFSTVSSFAIMGYIYIILCKRKYLWVAILLLSIATNIRPNALLLGALLFVLPWKEALRYGIYITLVFSIIFLTALYLSHILDTGYSLSSFTAGLCNYVHLYVTDKLGVLFNNSLYGALRTLFILAKTYPGSDTLLLINKLIISAGLLAVLLAIYGKMKKHLSDYEFAFVLLVLYTLSSTVFSVYHLLPFIVFLLILFCKPQENLSQVHFKVIIFTVIFVLVPKNYIFVDFFYPNALSIETILNPLIMLYAVQRVMMSISHE